MRIQNDAHNHLYDMMTNANWMGIQEEAHIYVLS